MANCLLPDGVPLWHKPVVFPPFTAYPTIENAVLLCYHGFATAAGWLGGAQIDSRFIMEQLAVAA
jgi:hypothetical protein